MDQPENTPWQYKSDNADAGSNFSSETATPTSESKPTANQTVAWRATEFIEHSHSSAWYGGLMVSTIALAAIIYLVTKDIFTIGTILVIGVIVGVFAKQKPGQAQYEISRSGVSVNGKTYAYRDFKSFSVFHEGPLSSLGLFPLKRFMPPVSAYFEPKDEQKIIDALGSYLPYQDRKLDAVDRLSRRLHL
jgi:hypothetical protein